MDEFDEFVSPTSATAQPPLSDSKFDADNAVDDFLAREAAMKLELEANEPDAIFTGSAVPTSSVSEPKQFGEELAFQPQTAMSLPASVPTSASANFDAPASFEPEGDAVRQWREKQAVFIAEKDKVAEAKRQETINRARKEIDEFYAEYSQKKQKQFAKNREIEKTMLKTRDEAPKNQNIWERAVNQIDFTASKREGAKIAAAINQQNQRSNSASNIAPEPPKRDVSRFKNLLLQLKNDTKAPGNELSAH